MCSNGRWVETVMWGEWESETMGCDGRDGEGEGRTRSTKRHPTVSTFADSTLQRLPSQWFLTIYIHPVIYKMICLKAKKEGAYGNFASIFVLDKLSSLLSPPPPPPAPPHHQTGEDGHAAGLTYKGRLNSRRPAPCCFLQNICIFPLLE